MAEIYGYGFIVVWQEHWHIDLKAQVLKYPIYSMAVHVRTYTIQHGDTLRLGEKGWVCRSQEGKSVTASTARSDWTGTRIIRVRHLFLACRPIL